MTFRSYEKRHQWFPQYLTTGPVSVVSCLNIYRETNHTLSLSLNGTNLQPDKASSVVDVLMVIKL